MLCPPHFSGLLIPKEEQYTTYNDIMHIFIALFPLYISERYFSALRKVKTWLRSTMRQDRLDSLMVCHVHRDRLMDIDLNEIANRCFLNGNTEALVQPGKAYLVVFESELLICLSPLICPDWTFVYFLEYNGAK